ncbi:trimethylamine methyltransferase family protein, partial [Mesorhizobium sp. BR1-1-7]
EKANKVWKERLASYDEPYMDPAIREELNAFVQKRRAEGGAPTDF